MLFAAAHSPDGGSHFILELAKLKKLTIFSSRLAVKESEKNLRLKAGEAELDRFYRFFEEIKITLIDADKSKAKSKYHKIVGEKDASILASAIKSKAIFLITLDRKHFLTTAVLKAELAIKIVTPGEFIQNYLYSLAEHPAKN